MTETKPAGGGPAFPCWIGTEHHAGLSMRDWMAGMALEGMLARQDWGTVDQAARLAWDYADAMLKERDK